jgi:hypothetical protein
MSFEALKTRFEALETIFEAFETDFRHYNIVLRRKKKMRAKTILYLRKLSSLVNQKHFQLSQTLEINKQTGIHI